MSSDRAQSTPEKQAALKEEQEAARETMREFEARDEVPSDPREWPDGKAKFLTFGNETDEPYGEGPTEKLDPESNTPPG